MNARSTRSGTVLALTGGAILFAAGASAQDQGSATTRALNTAPAQSTLNPRLNARPPVDQTPAARSPAGKPKPPQARSLDDVLADLLGPDATASAPGVTLAEGETEPEPIPLALGYYARGDKDCAEVWPGDGDLAFATPTSFTIDFGGCEPGQWLQTGPNSWREDQRCQTELGGDAGAYTISYEVLDAGTLKRTARLALDGSVEEDQWTHCAPADVPENARFAP
ncbi:hypothetical protein [Brevundimonas subvibrioides]|uniref:hypothetical protein n=1 Tax=Brevundimonas subvibrioides TaxID=74313 RepID=UPI0022B41354|nr:hypothetical protein [Brevundimonas subvibrioides]